MGRVNQYDEGWVDLFDHNDKGELNSITMIFHHNDKGEVDSINKYLQTDSSTIHVAPNINLLYVLTTKDSTSYGALELDEALLKSWLRCIVPPLGDNPNVSSSNNCYSLEVKRVFVVALSNIERYDSFYVCSRRKLW